MDQQNDPNPRPRYTWPWFLLGAVVLAIVLAVIWMTVLVRRIREERETNPWSPPPQTAPAQTNSPAIKTNAAALKNQRIAGLVTILRSS